MLAFATEININGIFLTLVETFTKFESECFGLISTLQDLCRCSLLGRKHLHSAQDLGRFPNREMHIVIRKLLRCKSSVNYSPTVILYLDDYSRWSGVGIGFYFEFSLHRCYLHITSLRCLLWQLWAKWVNSYSVAPGNQQYSC